MKKTNTQDYALIKVLQISMVVSLIIAIAEFPLYNIANTFVNMMIGSLAVILYFLYTKEKISYVFASRIFLLGLSLSVFSIFFIFDEKISMTMFTVIIPSSFIILRPLREGMFLSSISLLLLMGIMVTPLSIVEFSMYEIFVVILINVILLLVIGYYSISNQKYRNALHVLNSELEDKVQQRTQDLEEVNKQLLHKSKTDCLTGLFNRSELFSLLEKEFNYYERYEHDVCVILFDVDNFKSINDTYGHKVGDEVLVKLSAISEEIVRKTDFVARYGGEEFVVVLPSTPTKEAALVAEKLRIKFESLVFSLDLKVTASFGIAKLDGSKNIESLLHAADDAMYHAKNSGKNKVSLAS